MTRRNSESGVILVYVGLAIVMLMALSAVAVDMGFYWYAKSQAQNAADAGALAGAQTLATENSTWPFPSGGAVETVSEGIASMNHVFGSAPVADALAECPAWMTSPANVDCIRVRVYRDAAHSNPIPTF